jgi:hypothetical protein
MDGQLVQVCLPSHFLPELASPVVNLSPEVDELCALVHRLQAENHEFRQQAGYWKSRHRDNLKRINTLERKIEPTPVVFRALKIAGISTFLYQTPVQYR